MTQCKDAALFHEFNNVYIYYIFSTNMTIYVYFIFWQSVSIFPHLSNVNLTNLTFTMNLNNPKNDTGIDNIK